MPRNYYDESDEESHSSSDEDDSSDEDESCDEEDENCYVKAKRSTFARPYAGKRAIGQGSRQPEHKRSKNSTQHNNTASSNQQAGVYVLRNSKTNVCYVGKSTNIEIRILQHRRDNAPDVLNRESVLTSGSINDMESWERNEVLTRMYREGMDCVRGWRYTRREPLTLDDKISARSDIMEKFDLCRSCGRNNHFADKCFARSSALWCGDIPMH